MLHRSPDPRASAVPAPFTTRSSSRYSNSRCTTQAGEGCKALHVQHGATPTGFTGKGAVGSLGG
ncbi:hypothetical protein GCM10023080_087330 [Streptomyces pseudoechinosporeus]